MVVFISPGGTAPGYPSYCFTDDESQYQVDLDDDFDDDFADVLDDLEIDVVTDLGSFMAFELDFRQLVFIGCGSDNIFHVSPQSLKGFMF